MGRTATTTPEYDAVLAAFGGLRKLATFHLRIDRRAVYAWNGVIPKDRKWELYVLANGRLSLAQLGLQEDYRERRLPKTKKPRAVA